ncbi:hypothetical protein JHK82_036631 [Glycine max]|nr:hypothetical protein JHK82_036631 [Glycine max]
MHGNNQSYVLLRANFSGFVSSFPICWICFYFIYLLLLFTWIAMRFLSLGFFNSSSVLLVPSSSNIITTILGFMKRYLLFNMDADDANVLGLGIDVSPNSDCLLSHDTDLPCHTQR